MQDSFFPGKSTADPTKGVKGFLYTFNDCHTTNANREVISWVSETVDLLYPTYLPLSLSPQTTVNCIEKCQSVQQPILSSAAPELVSAITEAEVIVEAESSNIDETNDTDSTDDSDTDTSGISIFSLPIKRLKRSVGVARESSTNVSNSTAPSTAEAVVGGSNIEGEKIYAEEASLLDSRVLQLDLVLRGIGFVQVTDPQVDIGRVHEHMLRTQLMEEKTVKSRYVNRLLPIYTSCFSSIEALEKTAAVEIAQYFTKVPLGTSFCTIIERRTKNDTMDRDEIMKTCAEALPSDRQLKVEYKMPDVSIIVQVVGRATFLGFCPKYMELKKCNVQALAEAAMLEKAKDNEKAKNTIDETDQGAIN